jgi:ATP-dependent helicase HrpA
VSAADPGREALVERRRATRYTLSYPDSLPIAAAKDEIRAALERHRVIVVCGDTGSGKTTQLPKICLEAGRGVSGMIGHTQPRRIAAQAVAARLAEELDVKVGEAVGLEVRFTDQTSPAALIKVMTDGILLNEIRGDRRLAKYDTLIIDEAHERSLNIDFILGYLHRLERERPDLKVIITSATIDPERFARHFAGVHGDAPIIRVEGRSFPVEVRYRPPAEDEDLAAAVTAAANELAAQKLDSPIRDMLVFLPGERWIRDAERSLARFGPKGWELLPLYARLTSARQRKILQPGKAPRIVLATNIAETSLTVPRIRYVIDSGLARVSRYGTRQRVQSLGVEEIARANAVQRAGRCGRLAPGVCVRLYDESDFEERPEFTEPEILRTGLAGVSLKLESLRLGPVEDFPFIDAPPAKAVSDAYQLLYLLGATDAERRLTSDGELMARLPVDPRVARLLVVANRNGALKEALVIAAALSVVDPRETSVDPDAARRKHEEAADPRSDFTTYLNIWHAYRRERRGGERALRQWCKANYLSVARLREWHDVHGQLHELVQALGWRTRHDDADYRAVHQAVLAAFVDFIAEHDEGTTYRGMRDVRAQLFPGTPLAKKRPRWLVAAERIATERTYLRTVAQVNPRWALHVAKHLLKFEYDDPHWDRERGQVTAREVITLFGLTLSGEKRVDFGRVDPVQARRMFVADALAADALGPTPVHGPVAAARAAATAGGAAHGRAGRVAPITAARGNVLEPEFLTLNRKLRAEVLDWEARLRKRDLFVGEPGIAAFYDARLPAGIHDRATLATWCAVTANDRTLRMTPGEMASRDPAELTEERFPRELEVAGQMLPLRYRFEPGSERDGLTLEVPRTLLGAVRPEQIDWLVPGWLGEKVTALLRALPKELRRPLVPLPATAEELTAKLEPRRGRQSLAGALREALGDGSIRRIGRVQLDAVQLDERALPPHLAMRIEVHDAAGRVLAAGRDLRALQREWLDTGGVRAASAGGDAFTRANIAVWDLGDLPDRVSLRQGARDVQLYPCLLDVQGRVDVRLLPPGPSAVEQHRRGVRRLLLKNVPQQVALVRERTLKDRDLLLAYHGVGTSDVLVDDVVLASADESFALEPPIRTRAAFAAALDAGRSELVGKSDALRALLREMLTTSRELRRELEAASGKGAQPRVRDELAAQLAALVAPYCLSATPPEWRKHLPRYMRAARLRWEKRGDRKDAELAQQVAGAAAPLERWRVEWPAAWPWPAAMVEYRWLVEELRVSLFAQSLGTARPVSTKRLAQAWERAHESQA